MSLVAWFVLGALAGILFAAVYFRKGYLTFAPAGQATEHAFQSPVVYLGGAVLGGFGGFVGGFVYSVIASKGSAQFTAWSLLGAFLGAALVLYGFQILRRTGHGT